MYNEFIDLRNAPLNVQIAVRYMDLLARDEFGVDFNGIANFFKARNLEWQLAEALTAVLYEDEKILLLFHAAMYRFYRIHIPCFLKSYSENKEDLSFSWGLSWDAVKSWENSFWFDHVMGVSEYGKECALDMVHEEKDIIADIKKLQRQYEPFVRKAEKINQMVKNEQVQTEVDVLKKVTDIINRNLQGSLTAADVMELETNMDGWNKAIQNLVKFFDNVI